MLRRTFLQSAPGAALAAQATRSGGGNRLGFDTYSIRSFQWKALQFIEYAARLKLDTVQISSLSEFESLDPAHLRKVKDAADRAGITIDGGVGSICNTSESWNKKNGDPTSYLLEGLRVAKALGANAMRCFMGSAAERRSKLPVAAHMEATIKALRSVRAQALDAGVKIGIENHNGDLEAREVRTVIEEAGKDFAGSCLDTGNPMTLLEDPMFTLETLAPYVVTSHFRDSVVYEHPQGAAFQWVALGEGSIGIERLVARYRELCPRASMQLEIITGRPPQVLPYLEADFWKAFPNKRASEFSRFLNLVKKGHPFEGTMMIGGTGKQPPEYAAALKEQQRIDLERSLENAKKMGVGLGRG